MTLSRPAALLAASAVLAAACSTGGAVIATIDGVELRESDLLEVFDADTVVVDQQLRSAIFLLIARRVLLDGVDDLGIDLDTSASDELFDTVVADMEARGVTVEQFLGVPGATLEMVRLNADMSVLRRQVLGHLVARPGVVDDFLADPASMTTVCSSHVLVASEEEADEVLERLEGGESFGQVATEVSLDVVPSGDLGCRFPAGFVPEFADAVLDAPVGEAYGPVETEFGWHVILVRERFAPTREEILSDPAAALPEDDAAALWQEWFNERLREADVTVADRFGTWSPLGILPPGA